jgi:hypothetical protein
MVEWPAVIKYEGDDELTYVDSEAEWVRDSAMYLYNHSGNNVLIDSNGDIFSLNINDNGGISPNNTGDTISHEDFIRLVRIHASTANRCCIEKISFRHIVDGIKLIQSMNEQ